MFFFALSLMRFMAYVTCFLLIIESYVKLKAVSSSSDLDRIISVLLTPYPAFISHIQPGLCKQVSYICGLRPVSAS